MFTYDYSQLPVSSSASREIWLPRTYFPPTRRIIKQIASALYYEAFTASTRVTPGRHVITDPITLSVRRYLAIGPCIYKQTTVVSTNGSQTKFETVSRSQWSCSSHATAADAFVEFYSAYERHALRNPVEVVSGPNGDGEYLAVVNASASSEPLLVPYTEEDAKAVQENGFVRHIALWGLDLWSAVALKCETELEEVRPIDIPTVALGVPNSNWRFTIKDGLLNRCIETLLSISDEPEDSSESRVSVPDPVEVEPVFTTAK